MGDQMLTFKDKCKKSLFTKLNLIGILLFNILLAYYSCNYCLIPSHFSEIISIIY